MGALSKHSTMNLTSGFEIWAKECSLAISTQKRAMRDAAKQLVSWRILLQTEVYVGLE